MSYKIEKGIEMPKETNAGNRMMYPFGEMDVGDSFSIEGDYQDVTKIRSAACVYGRRKGKKFKVVKYDDDSYRAFRIE